MSADNWDVCPRCVIAREKKIAEAENRAVESYGKVPISEYHRLVSAARDIDNIAPLDTTLREDYEIGIVKGKFYVIYSGRCTECGFSLEYKHEQDIDASP